MAAAEEQEGNCRQFNLDDILKNLKETETEVSESSPSPNESEEVSMFCKACLNPYSGESKSGTIVLKCERCGQTDVVLEEKAVELDLDEWSGNLIMNRFLQVLKEQEDLQLNIIDPKFADDDYQHLTLALQEYTFNMKGIAEQMYDIARQARMECESLTEVSHSYDDTDEPNCQDSHDAKGNHSSTAGKPSLDTTLMNADQSEGPETVSKANSHVDDVTDNDNQSNWMPISTKARLKKLGATVTRMMQSVIEKYNLSPDIMDRVKERIRHPSNSDARGAEAPIDNSKAGNPKEDGVNSINETADDTICHDDTNDFYRTNSEITGGNCNTNQGVEIKGDGNTNEKMMNNADDDNGDVEEEDVDDKKKPTSGLVFPKEEIEEEVFGVLKSKFSIRFDRPLNEQPAMVEELGEKEDKSEKNMTNGIEELQEDIKSKPDSVKGASNYVTNFIEKYEIDKPEANDKEVKLGDSDDDDDDDDDYLQVNFCTVSSAFMNELQSRKQKALMERKDKALHTVHQKIVALKQEVERVENRVHEELTMAYQRKLKKVENQRKQLDRRHETIQNVEELMTHYAETGQNDKLAELMAQLDIQYEN